MKTPGKYTEYLTKGPTPPEAEALPEAQEAEPVESKCFGYMPSNRHPIMLELRQVAGDRLAIGYSYLMSAAFTGDGIELRFTGHKVSVGGTNLMPLYQRLVMHRVSFIQAVEAMHGATLPPDETVVEAITVEDA